MAKKAQYGSIVFQEKIDFFQNKLRLPTETYADVWKQQHAKAFVVAGAMQDDLLADLQSAVLKAIDGGSTLEDFRKNFDNAVKKHGWSFNGTRNWRSKLIYQTNTRMSYSAGRYKQMQAVKRTRPYWQYQHSLAAENARPQHLAWHNLVLVADDPWWNTHYPMNGFGCQCYVKTLSARDLKAKGLTVSNAPQINWTEKVINTTTNPRVVKVADGVDAGFDYNVGQGAWGNRLAKNAYDDDLAKLKNLGHWQPINTQTWQDFKRPEKIPFKPLVSDVDLSLDKVTLLSSLMGAPEKVFNVAGLPVLMNAEFIADHLPDNRKDYIPLITETLNDPYEVWQSFEVHKVSGKVDLKRRVIGAYTIRGKSIYIVLNVVKGVLIGWTAVPVKQNKVNKARMGNLVFFGKE